MKTRLDHSGHFQDMSFFDKLNRAVEHNQTLLCVELAPNLDGLSFRYRSKGGANTPPPDLQEWLWFLIAETADLVCAYTLTLDFYQVLGASGLALLRQILEVIPDHIPIILDAKHSNVNTSTLFARTAFLDWKVDAITLNSYAGQDQVAPFLMYPDKAVFILCTTANPSAPVLQQYPTAESPLYLKLLKEAKTWGTPEQVGLEIEVTTPDVLARIRTAAPERIILTRNIWEDANNWAQLIKLGLNSNGDGLLISVPEEHLKYTHPGESIRVLRDDVNQVRMQVGQGHPACSVWLPDVCLLKRHAYEDLILQLYDISCLQFGEFVQASGAVFPYYIDLRKIISNPQVFDTIITAYANVLDHLKFDRIAGIPYGSLPTATGLSLRLNYPMIFPRKEIKAHGARRLVEGNFHEGETVVVVDDILITGNSAMEGAQKLQSVGLDVQDIVVFIDHESGAKEALQESGYRGHAVLTLSEISETLYEARRIDSEQFQALKRSHD